MARGGDQELSALDAAAGHRRDRACLAGREIGGGEVYSARADRQRNVKPRVDQQLGAVGRDSSQRVLGQTRQLAGGKIFFAQLYPIDSGFCRLSDAVEKPRPALDAQRRQIDCDR